jgi:hypothetical protein
MRRQLKIPFLRTWAQGSHKTRPWKTDTERRDASRRDADSENQAKKKRREAMWHDAGKPTSSVATPVRTPTLDTIFSAD